MGRTGSADTWADVLLILEKRREGIAIRIFGFELRVEREGLQNTWRRLL